MTEIHRMTRDIAANVRLLEQGLPEQDEREHLYVEMLGHPVFPLRLTPGTGIVWEHVHGVGVTKDGVLVALVGSRHEVVQLGDGEGE